MIDRKNGQIKGYFVLTINATATSHSPQPRAASAVPKMRCLVDCAVCVPPAQGSVIKLELNTVQCCVVVEENEILKK